MIRILRQCLLAAVLFFALKAAGQELPGVQFSFDKARINDKEVVVSIKANIPAGVKLYALQKNGEDVLYSSIAFDSAFNKYLAGKIDEKGTVRSEQDPSASAAVNYFSDSVLWQQKLQLSNTDSLVLKGTLSYLYK